MPEAVHTLRIIMVSHLDNTLVAPFAEESPFAYGEHTVLQLRAQPFEVQDELGTVLTMPIDTNVRMPLAAVPVETVFAPRPFDEEPMARLERKLDSMERKFDLALRHIEKLQQRIESLDLTLARALSR